jgi:hypothetical protein
MGNTMKVVISNSHWVVLPFIFLLSTILVFRYYKYRYEEKSSLILNLSLGAVLLLAAILGTLLLSYNLWFHVVVVLLMNIGFYIVYFAQYNVLFGKRLTEFLEKPLFIVGAILTIITIALDFVRIYIWIRLFPDTDMPSFNYPNWYTDYATRRPNIALVPFYYWYISALFYVFYNITPSLLLYSIFRLYISTWHQPSDKAYLLRRVFCATGFFIGSLGWLAVACGSLFWMLGENKWRIVTTQVYQSAKMSMMIVVCSGFLIRSIWINKPLKLIGKYINAQRNQNIFLVEYVHNRITRIVPSVVIDVDGFDRDIYQMLIEISDARLILLSHYNLNAFDLSHEARLIHEALQKNIMIEEAGPFICPAIQGDSKHYAIKLAKTLEDLEKKSFQLA